MKALLLGAAFLLAPVGCAHRTYHQAKADYHHERAEQKLEDGKPIGAAKQKAKGIKEDRKADLHD